MMGEQSPKRLYAVRGKLYELLANCVPPELLLRCLALELLKRLDDELKVCPLVSFSVVAYMPVQCGMT